MKVDHFSLAVSDVDRSIDFYSRCFGFTVISLNEYDLPGHSQSIGYDDVRIRVAHLSLNDIVIEFIEYLNPRGARPERLETKDIGVPHLAFHTDDIDRDYERLAALGMQFPGPPGGSREAPARDIYGRDPDGIPIEIVQRPPAAQKANGMAAI